jgi:hypothetical protein
MSCPNGAGCWSIKWKFTAKLLQLTQPQSPRIQDIADDSPNANWQKGARQGMNKKVRQPYQSIRPILNVLEYDIELFARYEMPSVCRLKD